MSISQQTAHRTVILVLVLSGALGCVTSTTHDRVLGERDTLRRHAAALTSDKEALEAHVAGLEATRSSLTSELSATKANVSDLTGTYDGLLEDLKSEVAAGQIEIRQMRDGIRVRVDDEVLFASGSSEVDESGRLVMRKVASQLVGIPNPVRVDGHTDNVPISGGLKSKFPSNWELGGARATSIVRLLQEQGVAVGEDPQAVVAGVIREVAT